MSDAQFKQNEAMIRRHRETLRYLAILIERAGGEVVLLPSELVEDRTIHKVQGSLGHVHLQVKR